MIVRKKELIAKEIGEGTGASIAIAEAETGIRSGLRIWFADLEEKQGPVAEVRPHGLRSHRVQLSFGNFSGSVIAQIQRAAPEDVQLARALLASIRAGVEIHIPGQTLADWTVRDGQFRITATVRHEGQPDDDVGVTMTCREAIVPMMAAMAELIGYDDIEADATDEVPAFEGAILQSVVNRRERNPRNRLLCIRIHGERCAACGFEPKKTYGSAGSIIEVHHLEPLASLSIPKPYDPRTDLVPLCPNCHRAVHTRRAVPLGLDEVRTLMGGGRA